MKKYILLFIIVSWNSILWARPDIRSEMHQAFSAFKNLQQYMLVPSEFNKAENSEQILSQLKILRNKFSVLEGINYSSDPGYKANLKLFNNMLEDAILRFQQNKKSYALWRVRDTATFCVTCHTRLKLESDFIAPDLKLNSASNYDLGEFYLATRQFDKASKHFLLAALNPTRGNSSLVALRKWLIIYTRVHPNPSEAINTLESNLQKFKLSPYDKEQIQHWLYSLRQWKNDKLNSNVLDINVAQKLIASGTNINNEESSRIGNDEVSLLRASRILHTILEQGEATDNYAQVFYLLGVCYSRLPLFFHDDLALALLKQSIEAAPQSDVAKRAFRTYENLITLGFTGSSGSDLPPDVEKELLRLQELAYGK